MIGHLNKVSIFILVFCSCENTKNDPLIEPEIELVQIEEVSLDAERFVDFDLVGEREIIKEDGYHYVIIDGEPEEILIYEGQLISTTKLEDGYLLFFEPYNYWDDDLEMTVESETNFSLSLQITKEQADYLGYFEKSSETDDIKWDYFENLFRVSSYIDENQNHIPLKFEDLGKTEWDG